MKKNITIQIKAVFLLAVFSLNTLIGFACSIGIDIGFNSATSKEEATQPFTHIHSSGAKHQHQAKKALGHVHADGKKHTQHAQKEKLHHEKNQAPKKDKDDCCNDKVIKFQNIDKDITQSFKYFIATPVLVPIVSNLIDNNIHTCPIAPAKYVVRNFHPPPCSILITIQRFQI